MADANTNRRLLLKSPVKAFRGAPEGMNILFEPSANRRRKGILNLLDRCRYPVCNLQVRDCAPRGILAEDGKAIKIHRLLIADSKNGY